VSTCWYGCCGGVIAACSLAIYCVNETCGIGKQSPKQRCWKREETPANYHYWWKRKKNRHRVSLALLGQEPNWGNWRKAFAHRQNAYQNVKRRHQFRGQLCSPCPRTDSASRDKFLEKPRQMPFETLFTVKRLRRSLQPSVTQAVMCTPKTDSLAYFHRIALLPVLHEAL